MSEDVQIEIPSSPERISLPPGSEPSGPPSSLHPTPSPSPPPPANVIRIPPMKRPQRESRLFIDAPLLSPEEKAEYTEIGLTTDDVTQSSIQTVVGEYKEDGQLYYYARFTDGFVHKFPSYRLQREHPDLVEEYETKRDNGSLPPFDPSSHNVHPASRVRVVLKLHATGSKNGKVSRSKSRTETPQSDLDSDEDGESEADYGSDDSAVATRRSTRITKTKDNSSALPFSPRKTRSRKIHVIDDVDGEGGEGDEEEDDDELLIASPSVRRSTRSRKAVVRDNYVGSDDDAYAPTPKFKVAKKKSQPKASRPAYGRIRPIEDLKYDPNPGTRALRAHRSKCEKCQRQPTDQLKKRRKIDDEETEELGGWVQCLKCPVAAHWGCLAKTQQAEILKAALEREWVDWRSARAGDGEIDDDTLPKKRKTLEPNLTTEFLCGGCMKGGFCMSCKEVLLEPDSLARIEKENASSSTAPETKEGPSSDVEMQDATGDGSAKEPIDVDASPETPQKPIPTTPDSDSLYFRCLLCRRMSHYAHLPQPFAGDEYTEAELADYYQRTYEWRCADCVSYVYAVEHIIAWRPFPEDAKEKSAPGELPNYKSPLPREYLVKWKDRSYRRVQWVPHMWLFAKAPNMLRNFLTKGTHVDLLPEPAAEEVLEHAGDGVAMDVQDDDKTPPAPKPSAPSGSLPDAERHIRPAWKTIDRVLDVLLWSPEKRLNRRKVTKELQSEIDEEYENVFQTGEQPSADLTETVAEWEKRNRKRISDADASRVIFAFIKWDDLGYDDASWDSPPKQGTPGMLHLNTHLADLLPRDPL
ncbi:hypothetical protein QCA50_016355 [Cerrena zonata]|uniref:Chromo domain-containing protein n=1 Tax=Cerrena zonata TaxID=2478898 RepID=A0AAW0FFS6_9APHY